MQNLLKDKPYKALSIMKKAMKQQKYRISNQKGKRNTGNININITIMPPKIEPKNQVPNNKKIGLASIINTLWKILHSINIL